MNKIKVMVVMGGRSSEREVSLVSGTEVVRHLDETKYEILPVEISVDGTCWKSVNKRKLLELEYKIDRKLHEIGLLKNVEPSGKIAPNIGVRPDVVFIALSGQYGEDGTIQGMLELMGLKYAGCGVLASALGMDKMMFRKLIEAEGLPMAKLTNRVPCVVKPINGGSSIGVKIVKDQNNLDKAVTEAKKYGEVMVEEYIKGREFSCGILGDLVLPVIEIIPKNDFFDYEAKYTNGMSDEICPAEIDDELRDKIQDLTMKVFKVIKGRGYARVDFIVKDNQPYILEINTLPGMTPNSLLPKEARAMGIEYPQLLDRMIELGLE